MYFGFPRATKQVDDHAQLSQFPAGILRIDPGYA